MKIRSNQSNDETTVEAVVAVDLLRKKIRRSTDEQLTLSARRETAEGSSTCQHLRCLYHKTHTHTHTQTNPVLRHLADEPKRRLQPNHKLMWLAFRPTRISICWAPVIDANFATFQRTHHPLPPCVLSHINSRIVRNTPLGSIPASQVTAP